MQQFSGIFTEVVGERNNCVEVNEFLVLSGVKCCIVFSPDFVHGLSDDAALGFVVRDFSCFDGGVSQFFCGFQPVFPVGEKTVFGDDDCIDDAVFFDVAD